MTFIANQDEKGISKGKQFEPEDISKPKNTYHINDNTTEYNIVQHHSANKSLAAGSASCFLQADLVPQAIAIVFLRR